MTAATYSTDESLLEKEPGGDTPSAAGEHATLEQSAVANLVQSALRLLVFVVIPALLAGLVMRYLLPEPGNSEGWLHAIGTIGNQYPVPLAFGLFFLFTFLVRYWHWEVPRGAYLTPLAARLATNVATRDLRAYAGALELYRALAHPRRARRATRVLTTEQQHALHDQLAELATALQGVDAARVEEADRAIRVLASPALQAQKRHATTLFVMGLTLAGVSAWAIRHRVIETYQVLSSSMLPALTAGDRIVVSKLAYRRLFSGAGAPISRAPQRGDMVVFRNVITDGPEHVVKRVIGIPGDTITMNGDHPVINGWQVPSCDVSLYSYPVADGAVRGRLRVEFLGDHVYATVQGAGAPMPTPYVVKSDELFVVGDNRTNSSDSRSWNGGHGAGVPFDAIEGRADWFLVATRRNGRADFSDFLHSPDQRLAIEGIEARSVDEALDRCRSQKPDDTLPPATEEPRSDNGNEP